jgi:hypothetical protein
LQSAGLIEGPKLPKSVAGFFEKIGGGIANLTNVPGQLAGVAAGAAGRLAPGATAPHRFASLGEIQTDDRLAGDRGGRNEPMQEVKKDTGKLVTLFTEVRDALKAGGKVAAGIVPQMKVHTI